MSKIALCGIGKVLSEYVERLGGVIGAKDELVCYIDKEPLKSKRFKIFENVEILDYEHAKSKDIEIFVICSRKYFKEIISELKRMIGNDIYVMGIDEYIASKGRIRELIKMEQDRIKAISRDKVKNARVLSSREDALFELPQGGIAAEIGVAYGYFSRRILDNLKPDKFYAIDMFSEDIHQFWDVNFGEKTHYEWYRDAFKKDIEVGRLEMKKGLSWELMEKFEDRYFDYVYLDAGHDYESVRRDVEVLKKKMKVGGIIQFNDYIIYSYESQVFYGIVPVVNQLLAETNSELMFYCLSRIGYDDIVVKYFP